MSRPVRVRFAPSPTGPLHIGGVRTALYNYLFARKHGGTMILRVEDTDQTRFVEGAETYIMESLQWLGIELDESPAVGGPHSPYRQSERKPMYAQYAYDLIEKDLAYYAFDTEEDLNDMRKRLEAAKLPSAYNAVSRSTMKNSLTLPKDEVKRRLESGEPYVIRIKLPRNEDVRFEDVIRGWVVVNTSQMDDKVLLKSDGMPTYHLANVVDDYLMQISHVIRGEEWLPSAPLHVMLYRFLGWENSMPLFAHLPLLLKPDGNGKLSKRDGDKMGFPVFPLQWTDPTTGEVSSGYKQTGYIKEAVINMLALLGWHPSDNQEIFSMQELINGFSLERVSKSGAKFDLNKATWFNHHYLMHTPVEQLAQELQTSIAEKGWNQNTDYVKTVITLLREKVNFAKDILTEGTYFFEQPTYNDAETIKQKWKANSGELLTAYLHMLNSSSNWTATDMEEKTKAYCTDLGIKMGDIMPAMRIAVSGQPMGPPFYELLAILGKTEVALRLNNAILACNKLIA